MGGYSLKTKLLISQSRKAAKNLLTLLSGLVPLWLKRLSPNSLRFPYKQIQKGALKTYTLTPLYPYIPYSLKAFTPILLYILIFFTPFNSQSQAVRARLQFKTDSVVLGKSMELQMELMHPSHVEVMFPQKRDFLPYDLVNRQALSSEENGNIITEIVSFQIRSFDIAPKQAIRLPYEFIRGNDTLEAFVTSDSLPFAALITSLDSTYRFKIHQGALPLKDPPDYAQIILLCVGVMGIIALLYYVLRKPIQKWLRLQKLKREWKALEQELKSLGQDDGQQAKVLDQLNHIWKTYADPQGSHSLKSLTTSELKETLPSISSISNSRQSFLLNLIQKSDQVIYAGQHISSSELTNFLEQGGSLLKELYEFHRKGVA